MSDDDLDVDRLIHTISTAFDRHIVELQPGAVLSYDAPSWQDTIVFVTAGAVELECSSGERHCFRSGDIVCLAALPLRNVRSAGLAPARLLAVRRRARNDSLTG